MNNNNTLLIALLVIVLIAGGYYYNKHTHTATLDLPGNNDIKVTTHD